MNESIQDVVRNNINLSGNLTEEEIMELVDEEIIRISKGRVITLREREKIRMDVLHDIRHLGQIQRLIDDPEITEIMVNGTDGIFIEKKGKLIRINDHFESKEKLRKVIWQITAECNRVVNESSPIVDARLPDGARVNVVLDPVALNGPILTIRRFPPKPITMETLIEMNSISKSAAEYLKDAVENGYNILVSGGTGSGNSGTHKSHQRYKHYI